MLSDGTTDYIYGNGRIAQVNSSTEYFLADALGSVRQMTNSAGDYVFAQSYDPYGVVTYTAGESQTEFGFTGEQYGDSTQLRQTPELSKNSGVCLKSYVVLLGFGIRELAGKPVMDMLKLLGNNMWRRS